MTPSQSAPLNTLSCINGIMELYSDRIIVRKRGLISRFLQTFPGDSQTIPLYHLTGIKFYPGVMLANGVIRLMTSNGNLMLYFTHRSDPQALVMKDAIEDLLSRQHVLPELNEKLRGT